MKASLAQVFMGMGVVLASALTPVQSAETVNGGVIHFTGMIVEDPCIVSPQQNQFALTCPHEGKMQTTQVSYKNALKGQNPYPHMATVSMKYINPQKSLAVVQIDYR